LAGTSLDVITYGAGGAGSGAPRPRLVASDISLSEAGVRFRLASEWGEGEVAARVLGAFNVANLLAVTGALIADGIPFADVLGAVSALEPVPGRLERVGGGELPLVVIDYAHTPDALEKALAALRNVLDGAARGGRRGRLICVFGCG